MKLIVILLIGITSVSFAAIFIRFCSDVPPVTIATYRLIVAATILGIITIFKKKKLKKPTSKEFLLSVLSGIFLALHLITWILSLKLTSITSSVVLVTTNPIFVAIFSYFIFKEKQSKELIIGIILSFFGSIILGIGDGGISQLGIGNKNALYGDLLAIIGAIMASGYLITGSIIRKKVDTFNYILVVYSIAAISLTLFLFSSNYQTSGFKLSSWIYMFLLGAISQLIGHTSFNWALKHLKASMVAITILGEPIGASILAYLFFKETISLVQFIGIVFIFIAILVGYKKGKSTEIEDVAT